MADAITIKALQDASLDAKSLEEVVNGNEVKQVTTRKGETYPSVKKAIKTLFENGGLPATPYATKALMTASALANGSYAQVTDGINVADNGLYIKTAGAWNKSKYNVTNLMDDVVNAFYNTVINPPLEYLSTIIETYRLNLNVISGINDPKLLSGSVSNGVYFPDSPNHKTAEFIIPAGATHVKKYNFKTNVFLQYIDRNGRTLGGGMSLTSDNLALPIGAYAVRFSVFFIDPADNLNLTSDYVEFTKRPLLSYNTVLRKSNALSIIKHLMYVPEEYKFSSMPAFSTAITLAAAMASASNEVQIIKGYMSPGSGLKLQEGTYTVKIPIPKHAKEFYIISNLVEYVYTTKADLYATSITLTPSADNKENYIQIPENAKFLLYTVQNLGSTIDKENSKVVFLKEDKNELDLTNIMEQMADKGKVTIGNKLYTFVGDNYQIFRGSVFSGYHPTDNFSIEFTGTALSRNSDVGRYCTISNAGNLTTKVYDVNRTLVDEKTTQVFKKAMPTTLIKSHSASNKLQVLFIGDSLFHNNANAIGAEWLRMINTDSAVIPSDSVVYPKGYNIGKGDIELVGRIGSGDVKYDIANTLAIAMTGTGTGTSTADNPFYNPSSTKPDSIGADGWHNRVDLVWYFQSICGVGKYPAYIYLACGVNDIVASGWDINALPAIEEKYKSLLARIKSACDIIAGGSSSVQILAVNHQFYPIDEGSLFAFSPQLQRMNYAIHYKEYERMINEDIVDGIKLSSYVRYIDCSSAFDTEYGYSYRTGTVNARQTNPARYINDMVHIGMGGSAMYADGLLRDFLYHECN